MQILGFPDSLAPARRLADALGGDCGAIDVHRFPDGESLVTLPPQLADTVVLFRGLEDANARLVELLLACDGARANGARRIILVAPYLCYMRQDKAFHPGQAVSQRIIGEHLSRWVDDLITVDPHLHRIARLDQALPHCNALATSAAPLLGEFLRGRGGDGVLVGPDEESRQWVEQVALASGLPFVIATKERLGDREVRIALPAYPYRGADAILVDDVISSGKTMAETARQLRAAGAGAVSALCTHALFAPGALEAMAAAGIGEVWSSSAIAHGSNRIDLTPVLAEAVLQASRV
ncbi:MAG: ribose-phosphate diphosphokinase [Porticoccaceae bacterium]|jgi:ribose-phosphate pyrophosphokinase|nr:ribose-phosphate diphosphokinase [Porticoccaceae bacterium]